MMKRIETATEIVTVDEYNVVHVEIKQQNRVNIPRNFSFATLGKLPESSSSSTAIAQPALFTLFVEDYNVQRGTYADMYDGAWKAYGNLPAGLPFSFIIC